MLDGFFEWKLDNIGFSGLGSKRKKLIDIGFYPDKNRESVFS